MARLVLVFLFVLSSISGLGSAQVPLPAIPDHHHWTVNQFVSFWNWKDPSVEPLVTTPANADPHEPAGEELDHREYLVDRNVTKSIGADRKVVVLLKKNPKDLKMGYVPVAGTWPVSVWLGKKVGGAAYAPKDLFPEDSAWVTPEHTNEFLVAAKYLTNDTRENHPAWLARSPIYEGGTVGVIINGHDQTSWTIPGIVGIVIGGVAVFLVQLGLAKRK
ncbi:MAG: hypothetical protein NTY35_14755 [Planctomycetota bacterium]|nr:hypothetical protein [Planctomycetota bacterium]